MLPHPAPQPQLQDSGLRATGTRARTQWQREAAAGTPGNRAANPLLRINEVSRLNTHVLVRHEVALVTVRQFLMRLAGPGVFPPVLYGGVLPLRW